MLRYSLILLAAAGVSLFAPASPAAAQADCQTTEIDTGQGVVRQTMCRGADGVWRPQQTAPAAPGAGLAVGGGAFPQGWSGRVTYTGSYQGAIETPGRPMRRFTLDEAVRSATSGSREEIGGPYTLELTIEGNAVSGRLTATGGVRNASVSGTRNGDRCRLFIGDVSIEAECTASRFDGRARTQGNARRIYNYRIDAEATRVIDNRAEAARREQAAAESQTHQAEQRAERERAAQAEAARIAALPRASQAQTDLLERAVRQDSGAWMFNRYDIGSMTNVRVFSNAGGITTLRGEYTYNGGSRGWVEARVSGGRVECLGYWDVGGCSTVRGGASGAASPATQGAPAQSAASGVARPSMSRQETRQAYEQSIGCYTLLDVEKTMTADGPARERLDEARVTFLMLVVAIGENLGLSTDETTSDVIRYGTNLGERYRNPADWNRKLSDCLEVADSMDQ